MFSLPMDKIQLTRRVIHSQVDMRKFDNQVMTIANAIAFRESSNLISSGSQCIIFQDEYLKTVITK